MVFNRKRKDNRSSSFILDDSPKRTKVQAQRKFAQGSNVNSPVLTPVTEIEIQEKVMPEPIELLPMKRPNTEDFLTFLCFRGTPALPPSLSFFNNASMTEGGPAISESPSSSKNGVIMPSNISKTQGEKPFIAFGVRKRADPIVVSRHMDKKRRHALALQALRRKYQEQKMAKIRAITISKLSEKVHTNKTVVRTTRSVTKAEPISKKNVGQKTKITVVATKHVKVTTRRTSTQIKQTASTGGIKQKMCLRNLRNRVVKREMEKKKPVTITKKTVKQEKVSKDKEEDDDDDEEEEEEEEEVENDEDDEDYSSDDSESQDEKDVKKKYQSRKESDARVTRSNIIATRRNKRLMLRQTNLKAVPTSPVKLRSQLRRKMLQSKSEIKVPLTKRRILTRKVQIKTKTVSKKVETKPIASKEVKKDQQEAEEKVKKGTKVEDKRTTVRETSRKRQETSPEVKKTKVKKPAEVKKKPLDLKEEKNKKLSEDKNKKAADDKSNKKVTEEKLKKSVEDKNKVLEEKNKKLVEEKKKKVIEDKNKKVVEDKVVNKKVVDDKNEKVAEDKCSKEEKLKEVKSPVTEVKKKEVKAKETTICKTPKESPGKETIAKGKEKKEIDIKQEVIKQEKPITKKVEPAKKVKDEKEKKPVVVNVKEQIDPEAVVTTLPIIENNRIIIDKDVVIEEVKPFRESTPPKKLEDDAPKVCKKQIEKKSSPKSLPMPKKIEKKPETKPKDIKEENDKIKDDTSPSESKISQRPSRKTKVAAAIYMEILGRKLVNDEDIDDMSIDSFPELPNVRRMEQRENELKAKMNTTNKTKPKDPNKLPVDKKSKESESETEKSLKQQSTSKAKAVVSEPMEKRKTRNPNSAVHESASSDKSFTMDLRTPPLKVPPQTRQTRNGSPKLYKSYSDTESEAGIVDTKKSKKRKSENASDLESSKKPVAKKKAKKVDQEDGFSESDEEPLAKLTQKASEKSKSETESNMAVKQKRECTKRPQNYLPLFSSSDEEEKFFRGFQTAAPLPALQQQQQAPPQPQPLPAKKKVVKPVVEPIVEPLLSTKDIGRRFGKGKVNMSNEQIEKWLNDSAMAGMTLIKAENDEMLKFGERIPTETSLDGNLSTVNMEHLKNSLLKTEIEKEEVRKPDPISSSVNTTPDKSTTSSQKPLSNEKKTIFHKADKLRKNMNAFSACNESSVYAFEADNEDSVSTPFRRPSRRPSSTATSRSEDDVARLDLENKSKFRLPTNVTNKTKQEVSLMLMDESNNSGSITVQVNLESTDNEPQTQGDNEHMFYIPFQPGHKPGSNIQGVSIKMGTEGTNNSKLIMSAKLVRQHSAGSIPEKSATTPMFPPSSPIPFKKLETKSKASCSMSETSDDFKYKVPSSPSASSSSSAKLVNKRKANEDFYKPINTTEFPNLLSPSQIVEAPVFHPTEKEFVDPLEYISKIRDRAERFGICRIIPPTNFKPECKVLDEMRFTAYNQYVHKMMHRWGPNFRELVAIRKYLATQSISLKHPPWIGGIEIDLPKLYQTVQTLGGLKEVIEKKKWSRVSELMKIPKLAQDRVTKLDDIYCKYLLPYDTLSPDEREKLFASVELDWAKRETKMLEKAKNGTNPEPEPEPEEDDDDQEESDEEDESDIECIVKGRSMALSAFYRIARNTMAMWFKEGEPTPQEVEEEFWKHVTLKQHHICVHSGSIDSGNLGYGFAVTKNSPFARHAWNLKVLTNNSGSILRSMGPVMGLTVPTLHVGMLYAGCCWYRDPHSLPWIEYLHTGANKIWYGIPDSMSDKFHETMVKLVPHYCLNKSLWLPTDTVMVPPSTLVDNGVSLTKTVQEPGQFVVIFPKAFTSNICAGYVVSESVFWAPPDWLTCADKVFLELRNSCEPSMFSYERLLLSMAEDTRSDVKVLRRIIPPIQRMIEREKKEREKIKGLGINKTERLPLLDAKRKKKMQDTDTEYICEDCRWNLYCSMICDSSDNGFYCLEHAIEGIQEKRIEIEHCKLMYTYDDGELNGFVDKINATIEAKLVKKVGSKFSGMATLLNR